MMRVVIVGAGQAGAALAAKLRALGAEGPILMIGDEASPPYQRPPLSKAYLMGEMEQERLWLRNPDFWAANQIELRLGQAVTAIDRVAKTVSLGSLTLPYDQLALTTGSSPRRLPAAIGGDLRGVFTLRSLQDVDRMRGEFTPGRSLAVVGGGYIGLEAAAVARKLGLDVTLIEMAPRILGRVASVETADFMRRLHSEKGVTLLENTKLERILGETAVTGIRLEDGREIKADFVIVGVGIQPGSGLAAAAGLALDNGIATDPLGRSSDPDIWAAGDCASFPWKGGRIRLESVGNAIDQAECVAENMLGAAKPYDPKPWFWSDQYDLKLQIAGLNIGYDRVITREIGGLSHWYYRGPELLAVDAMGDARAYMVGKRLIDAGKSPAADEVASAPDLRALLK